MVRSRMIRMDTSEAILRETIGVLRDKFHWGGYRLHAAKGELAGYSNVVEPTKQLNVIEYDLPDNRILECAVEAGSDYILSEDKDLLRLGEYEGIQIMRAADFLLAIQPKRK